MDVLIAARCIDLHAGDEDPDIVVQVYPAPALDLRAIDDFVDVAFIDLAVFQRAGVTDPARVVGNMLPSWLTFMVTSATLAIGKLRKSRRLPSRSE